MSDNVDTEPEAINSKIEKKDEESSNLTLADKVAKVLKEITSRSSKGKITDVKSKLLIKGHLVIIFKSPAAYDMRFFFK